MSKPCRICCDSRRLKIDQQLVKGDNMSEISRQFNIPYSTICNHKQNHLSRQLLKSQEIRELTMAETVAKDVSSIYSRLNSLLDKAEKKNHTRTFVMIAQEIRAYSEFLLRLQATFENMAREEGEKLHSDDAVIIDVSKVDDITLRRLFKLLSEARTEGGKPIPAAPSRETLH